jgi:putative transposase
MIETIILESGCYYHIYNRGNNSETLFAEEKNYAYFLQLWKKYVFPVADTYAYCLLDNHFHMMLRIKETVNEEGKDSENLPILERKQHRAFSNFFNAYSKAFNKKYNRTGKLFEERYKRKEVNNPRYFTQLIYYIHANPQKHGFRNDFRDYPYSSYASLLSEAPTLLMRKEVLDWFGGKRMFMLYHENVYRKLADELSFEIE